jgi:prepilin-type N-terminal cleavage/methylation domain-containing protein
LGGGSFKNLILSGFKPIDGFKKVFNPAFTLAEVLITLGIIGVVAAMTIPTLMAKINERQTVVKLKKAYSTLSNAYRLLEHDDELGGGVCITGYDTKNNARTDTPRCAAGQYDSQFDKFAQYIKTTRESAGYTGYTGTNNSTFFSYYKFMLPWEIFTSLDGLVYLFSCGGMSLVLIDVNGPDGKPNEFGKDIFGFEYGLDSGEGEYRNLALRPVDLTTANYGNAPRSGLESKICDKDHIGIQCTAQVLETGRMDYLK